MRRRNAPSAPATNPFDEGRHPGIRSSCRKNCQTYCGRRANPWMPQPSPSWKPDSAIRSVMSVSMPTPPRPNQRRMLTRRHIPSDDISCSHPAATNHTRCLADNFWHTNSPTSSSSVEGTTTRLNPGRSATRPASQVEAEAVSREVIPDQRPARPEPRAPVPVGLIFDHTPVIQRKPTTSQAGTVAQFIVVFNSTPSGMSQTTGQDAHNAMLRLGETEMSWTGPLPTTTPYFNQRPARYIYTTQGGWIDMVHFLFHAGRAYKYLVQQRDAARSLAEIEAMPWFSRMWLPSEYMDELYRRSGMSPIGESVQEGFQTEQLQSVVTPHSAYSYEDLPSDTFGARFAVQHFNPNARQSLGSNSPHI